MIFHTQDLTIARGKIQVTVSSRHALVLLSNTICWEEIYSVVESDLKNTAKFCWHRGRKLHVRIHLGAYFLRAIKNLSYRKLEQDLRENAASQMFCGAGMIKNWKCPDHTRMERFASRLSPETQRELANYISKVAVRTGFAEPSALDIDSTIQEANIRYPNDLMLVSRLVDKSKKILNYLRSSGCKLKNTIEKIDAKSIKSKVKSYLFNRKNWSDEKKSSHQLDTLNEAKKYIQPVIDECKGLASDFISQCKWNIKESINQLCTLGEKSLLQVQYFAETGKAAKDKILSLHQSAVSCFMKRQRRTAQFGRRIQLGRITGNFFIVPNCEDSKRDDRRAVKDIVKTHQRLFGIGKLKSCATDTGYHSKANEKYLESEGVVEIGIQKPGRTKHYAVEMPKDIRDKLYDRRAGVEPLIGHCKQGGQLGRHRARTDKTGLAAAYLSVLGFNLRQMMNKLDIEEQEMAI